MGCCNASVLFLVVCTLQLITVVEWLVFNFLGYLYLAFIPCFIQVIFIIIAIFGLCLYKHTLIISYLVWTLLYTGWNIFVICLYLQVGNFDENSYSILSFGSNISWWVKRTRECAATNTCALNGNLVEVIHASLQVLLCVVGCVLSSYVIHMLKAKVDPSPIFQVYKVPTSRRSSISSRVDRENTLTRVDPLAMSGRASLRSNRSERFIESNTAQTPNSTRQSKRSNRASQRSKRSSQNNGSTRKRPGSLPWVPTVTASSGVDSDMPQSPHGLQPPIGHVNESYGYGSSSNSPYNEYPQRFPGQPPGPLLPGSSRHSSSIPSQSFNTVADLPPPLDEGPEAYSRDSLAYLPPPPPLSDGPEPYRSAVSRNVPPHHSQVSQRSHNLSLHISTPTKEPLSSSGESSPGSSISSTEKNGDIPPFNSSRTLEHNLDQGSVWSSKYDKYHQPSSTQPNSRVSGGNQFSENLRTERNDSSKLMDRVDSGDIATSNPLYANHKFARPGSQMPNSNLPPAKTHQPHHLNAPQNRVPPIPHTNAQQSNNKGASSQDIPILPTSELRQIRGGDSHPKENTFKRLVSGSLMPQPNSSRNYHDSPTHLSPPSDSAALSSQRSSPASALHQESSSNISGGATPHFQEKKFYPPSPDRSDSTHKMHINPQQQNLRPFHQNDRPPVLHQSRPPSLYTANHITSRSNQSAISNPPHTSSVPHMNGGASPAAYTSNNSNIPSRTYIPQENSSSNAAPNARQAAYSLNNALTEVTSSYGGLYSSKSSAPPSRRRPMHPPPLGSTTQMQYQLANITDDAKTSKEAFVSMQPSVI